MGADMMVIGFVADDKKLAALRATPRVRLEVQARGRFWREGMVYGHDLLTESSAAESLLDEQFETDAPEGERVDGAPFFESDRLLVSEAVADSLLDLVALMEDREIDFWKGPTSTLYVTGGLSWGDVPTDAFEIMAKAAGLAHTFCPGLLEQYGVSFDVGKLLP